MSRRAREVSPSPGQYIMNRAERNAQCIRMVLIISLSVRRSGLEMRQRRSIDMCAVKSSCVGRTEERGEFEFGDASVNVLMIMPPKFACVPCRACDR